MAITTVNDKLAIMEFGQVWEPGLPISPSAFGQDDQQQLIHGYPGALWVSDSVPVAEERPRPGGGRIIGYFPPEHKKKREVKIRWTDEHERELARRLRAIDDDYERKRSIQYLELLEVLRNAIHLGNQISFSGFQYLTAQDIQKARRKIQIEEENAIILTLLMS